MMENKIRFVFISLALMFLVSCSSSEEEKKTLSRKEKAELKRQDSLALKIAVMPTLECLPIYIAKENNLYDSLNVDVRLRKYKSQMDCDTSLIGKSVEVGVTDLIRKKYMEKKGMSLEIITSTNSSWQLITNRTSRLKQLKQLGDKMVAMSRYSATEYLTNYALKNVKTTDPVFRIQINDIPLRLRMLMNNEMDAVWLPEPQATVARLSKNPVLMDSKKENISLGIIVVNTKLINNQHRKNQIDKFIKAYNIACDSINKNGLEYYANIISKYCYVDVNIIPSIPKTTYSHAKIINNHDIELADNYMK